MGLVVFLAKSYLCCLMGFGRVSHPSMCWKYNSIVHLSDWPVITNLKRQMVCSIEPSEMSSLETVLKRADSFKNYLACDCMKHLSLSIDVLPCETAGLLRS